MNRHFNPGGATGAYRPPELLQQHADGLDELVYPRSRIVDQMLIEVIDNPAEILPNLGRQLDAGHRYFASLRTEGGFAALPATRPSR